MATGKSNAQLKAERVSEARADDGPDKIVPALQHFKERFERIMGEASDVTGGPSSHGNQSEGTESSPLLSVFARHYSTFAARAGKRLSQVDMTRFGCSIRDLLHEHGMSADVMVQIADALFDTLPQAAQYFHERPRCKGGAAKGLQSPPGGAEQGAKAKSGEQDSAASSPKKRNRPSKKQAALKPEEPVAKGIEGPFGVGVSLAQKKSGAFYVESVEWWAERFFGDQVQPGDEVMSVDSAPTDETCTIEEVNGWLMGTEINTSVRVTLRRHRKVESWEVVMFRKRPPVTGHLDTLPAPQKSAGLARVVVIGAGAAGLACARKIIQGGRGEVTVVEARERTGGRIHTAALASKGGLAPSFVDLGASFVHGCDDRINPIFELAKKHNTRVDDVWGGYSSCWGERCEFYKDGKKISRKSVQRAFEVASPLSLCSHADAAMQVMWDVHTCLKERAQTTAVPRVKCARCQKWRTFPEVARGRIEEDVANWTCDRGDWNTWTLPSGDDACGIGREVWEPRSPEDTPLEEALEMSMSEVCSRKGGEGGVSKSRQTLVGDEKAVFDSGVIVAWGYVAALCDLALGQGFQAGESVFEDFFLQPPGEESVNEEEEEGKDDVGAADREIEQLEKTVGTLQAEVESLSKIATRSVEEQSMLTQKRKRLTSKEKILNKERKKRQEKAFDPDDDNPLDVIVENEKRKQAESAKGAKQKRKKRPFKLQVKRPSASGQGASKRKGGEVKKWRSREMCEIYYAATREWYKGYIDAVDSDWIYVKYTGLDCNPPEKLQHDTTRLRPPQPDDGKNDEPIDVTDGIVVEGYSNFLIKLIEKDVPVRLNTKVKSVRVREGVANPVTVFTEDLVDGKWVAGDQLNADYCVVTIPLGVLQKGTVAFEPPLPGWKQEAITALGMGVENKVILRYQRHEATDGRKLPPFWGDKDPYIQCMDHRFRFINGHYFGLDGVIIAHVGPPFSRGFEGMSDDEVVVEVRNVLNNMYGHKANDSRFIDGCVTRWDEDEFSLGSYSYMKRGSHVEHVRALAASCHSGRLYFAGEACSVEAAQCVHGAFSTGEQAASDIYDHYGLYRARHRT